MEERKKETKKERKKERKKGGRSWAGPNGLLEKRKKRKKGGEEKGEEKKWVGLGEKRG